MPRKSVQPDEVVVPHLTPEGSRKGSQRLGGHAHAKQPLLISSLLLLKPFQLRNIYRCSTSQARNLISSFTG
jgi:hypothetical protein